MTDTTKTALLLSPLSLESSAGGAVGSEDLSSKVQAVGVTGLTERAEGRWLVAH